MSINFFVNKVNERAGDLSADARRRAALRAEEIYQRTGNFEIERAINEQRAYVQETEAQRQARMERERAIAAERERARLAEIARLHQLRLEEEARLERERIQRLNNKKASVDAQLSREIDAIRADKELIQTQVNILQGKLSKLDGQNKQSSLLKFKNFDSPNTLDAAGKIVSLKNQTNALDASAKNDDTEKALTDLRKRVSAASTIEQLESEMQNRVQAQKEHDFSHIDSAVNQLQSLLKDTDVFLEELVKIDACIGNSMRYADVKADIISFYRNINFSDQDEIKKGILQLGRYVKDLQIVAQQENDLQALHKISCLLDEMQDIIRKYRPESVTPAKDTSQPFVDKEGTKLFGAIRERGLFLSELTTVFKKYLRASEEQNIAEVLSCVQSLRSLNEKSETVFSAQQKYNEMLERRNSSAARCNKPAVKNAFSLEHCDVLSNNLKKEAEAFELEILCKERDQKMEGYNAAMVELGYTCVCKAKEIDAATGTIRTVYASEGEIGTALAVEIDIYGSRKDYAVGVEIDLGQKKYVASAASVLTACKKTKDARKSEVKRQLEILQVPTEDDDLSPDDDEIEFPPILLSDKENREELNKYLEVTAAEMYEENGQLKLRRKLTAEVAGGAVIDSSSSGGGVNARVAEGQGQQRAAEIPKNTK